RHRQRSQPASLHFVRAILIERAASRAVTRNWHRGSGDANGRGGIARNAPLGHSGRTRATGDGDGRIGGTSFTGGGAAHLTAGLSGLSGQGAGGGGVESPAAHTP